MAAKNGDEEFIRNNYEELLRLYDDTYEEIKKQAKK